MPQLTKQQCEDFWKLADKNGDGEVTILELKAAISKQVPDKDLVKMFTDIDKDGDKKISWDEFSQEMMKLEERAQGLLKLFKSHDKSGDGFLSVDELKNLVCKSGQFKNPEDVAKSLIDSCDKDGDGQISFEEFKKALD